MARKRDGSAGTKPRAGRGRPGPRLPSVGPVTLAGRPTQGTTSGPDTTDAQALVASYWFDSGEGSEPYTATVRFNGRRVGVKGNPRRGDSFVHDEVVDGIVPGSGPVSITATVTGLKEGEWTVTADVIHTAAGRDGGRFAPRSRGADQPVNQATWSWRRWSLSSREPTPIKTRWALLAPLARRPAVIPGIYTALAIVGFVVALGLQGAILARGTTPVAPALEASLIGLVAGLIGAKTWYKVLHPDESVVQGGWAVDGFLVIAPLATIAALRMLGVHPGAALDALAPGLFFAIAIGRLGCFLAGCCAGRCTSARSGIWSSDRRVGARRIPAQLLESGAGLVLGLVTLIVVLANPLAIHGATFVVAFALYAVVRQALLRLRAERRRSYRTLPATAAAAGLVVVLVSISSLHLGA